MDLPGFLTKIIAFDRQLSGFRLNSLLSLRSSRTPVVFVNFQLIIQ